jgi:hypothetical protein
MCRHSRRITHTPDLLLVIRCKVARLVDHELLYQLRLIVLPKQAYSSLLRRNFQREAGILELS